MVFSLLLLSIHTHTHPHPSFSDEMPKAAITRTQRDPPCPVILDFFFWHFLVYKLLFFLGIWSFCREKYGATLESKQYSTEKKEEKRKVLCVFSFVRVGADPVLDFDLSFSALPRIFFRGGKEKNLGRYPSFPKQKERFAYY